MKLYRDNPEACVCKGRLDKYDGKCAACYFAQVGERGWEGSEACWNAQCLVFDPDSSPLHGGNGKYGRR